MSTALVLGGGGVAGIAWTTGVLLGMAEAGAQVHADSVVGTSAGATVAAQLSSGTPLSELYARQLDPRRQVAELVPPISLAALTTALDEVTRGLADIAERRRAVAAMASSAVTPPAQDRLAVIRARLPRHMWPSTPLSIIAVDGTTGERHAFTAASGVDLVDAVAASCAVPGIWPPVDIEGHPHVDGGVWSANNADLAAGASQVTVIAPMPPDRTPELADEVATLTANGAVVTVVHPGDGSRAAIGPDPLDPTRRAASAMAGRLQGRRTRAAGPATPAATP